MKQSSILNEVLGPIMTGPSSSHTAAQGKIGRAVRNLWGRPIASAAVVYDCHGSYPNTHEGQGCDFGFTAGLLGLDMDDPRFRDSIELARRQSVEIEFRVESLKGEHPNEARVDIRTEPGGPVGLSVLSQSTGGGTFLLTELNGFPISYDGQREKAFLICAAGEEKAVAHALTEAGGQFVLRHPAERPVTAAAMPQGASALFEVELISLAGQKLPEEAKKRSLSLYCCAPLVSVPLRLRPERGFFTAEGALKYAAEHQTVSMAELAVVYETRLGSADRTDLEQEMLHVLRAMERSMTPPPADDPVPKSGAPSSGGAGRQNATRHGCIEWLYAQCHGGDGKRLRPPGGGGCPHGRFQRSDPCLGGGGWPHIGPHGGRNSGRPVGCRTSGSLYRQSGNFRRRSSRLSGRDRCCILHGRCRRCTVVGRHGGGGFSRCSSGDAKPIGADL